jgi:hypothetical protein
MANFKLAKKDALSDTRTNIYDLHDKKMEYFETEKSKLNEYQNLLEKYKKKVKSLSNDSNEIYKINNDIRELEQRIENITDDSELNDYLLDFFQIINKNTENIEENGQRGKMDNFIQSTINNSKSEMYNDYVKTFNPELKEISVNKVKQNFNICEKCKTESCVFDLKSCTDICTVCGLSTSIIYNDDSSFVYTETVEQVIVFNYKRNNHFQECLNQLQAKENTTIPPQIIKDLTFEFKKYNITDPKLFTPTLVKSYLKKLKYNKYYEHIPTIINEFCGLRAPKLTSELEQQLKIMFDEIQNPFEKYSRMICPLRKNFLNYNYVFYKMCQLLGKDEFLNFFPLLKSREKLYEHDLIWKGICQDLQWEFIPSI